MMPEAWSRWEGHVVNEKLQLKKYLGGSEQSAVFLTNHPEHEAEAATIKLIACDPANAELQLARWRKAQGISHPNLVRIFDVGSCRVEDRDLIFAVMEHAEESLAQIVTERPLTAEEAREMLTPILDVLACLHVQGFVLGTLKPGNVLATNDQLKLSSDGIGRAGETASYLEQPGVYDPPEMAGGRRSPAADVWSLDMTLAQVLTQRLPAWNQEDRGDPAIDAILPAPFQEIVRGCLRRDPESRFTVADIAERLYAKSAKPQPQAAAAKPHSATPTAGVPPSQLANTGQAGSPGPPSQLANTGQAGSPGPGTPAPLPQKPVAPARVQPAQASRAAGAIPLSKPWVWRTAFPVAIAILGVAALFAGFRFLRHQPETQPDAAAVKTEPAPRSEQKAQSDAKRTRLPLAGGEAAKPDPGRPSRKTESERGPLSASAGPDASTAIKPQQASLRSAAQTTGGNSIPNSDAPDADAGPGVAHRVLPDVPKSASETISGTIKVSVRVNVGPSGGVAGAEMVVSGPSRYFARLALEAAQKWRFVPSQDSDRDFLVNFEFRNSGTRAHAARAGG